MNRKRPTVTTQYQDKSAPLVPSPLNHSSLFTPVSSTHKVFVYVLISSHQNIIQLNQEVLGHIVLDQ